jgi:hypothetical protein
MMVGSRTSPLAHGTGLVSGHQGGRRLRFRGSQA